MFLSFQIIQNEVEKVVEIAYHFLDAVSHS